MSLGETSKGVSWFSLECLLGELATSSSDMARGQGNQGEDCWELVGAETRRMAALGCCDQFVAGAGGLYPCRTYGIQALAVTSGEVLVGRQRHVICLAVGSLLPQSILIEVACS